MAASHGCNDNKDVVEIFKEALKQRIGQERFDVWFQGVQFHFAEVTSDVSSSQLTILVNGQFALERISKNFLSELRGAASQATGLTASVRLELAPARQIGLPLESDGASLDLSELGTDSGEQESGENVDARKGRSTHPEPVVRHKSSPRSKRGLQGANSIRAILRDGTTNRSEPTKNPTVRPPVTGNSVSSGNKRKAAPGSRSSQPSVFGSSLHPTSDSTTIGNGQIKSTWESFVPGAHSQLAFTACQMVIQTPSLAAPLFLWGAPGSGKTHLLQAMSAQLKRVHRLRRVMMLSAEAFTNDFIRSVSGSGLPGFRSRYRDVDALLIDDVQFMGDKNATLRELLYTIETLAESGRPMIFAATQPPGEIPGLSVELSGRMAGGLVCQIQSLDAPTRRTLLQAYASDLCPHDWPTELLDEISSMIAGDGRVIQGLVRSVAVLQQMYGRMPTINEINQSCGHLLRRTEQPITLSAIERAVEKVFEMPLDTMQTNSRTKTISEPRMLAMYLSRQWTSCAFGEIGRHYGGRSHSTAILASKRVEQWLENGQAIGRSANGISVSEAVRKIESLLRTV